jgi:hypothetical protein
LHGHLIYLEEKYIHNKYYKKFISIIDLILKIKLDYKNKKINNNIKNYKPINLILNINYIYIIYILILNIFYKFIKIKIDKNNLF